MRLRYCCRMFVIYDLFNPDQNFQIKHDSRPKLRKNNSLGFSNCLSFVHHYLLLFFTLKLTSCNTEMQILSIEVGF